MHRKHEKHNFISVFLYLFTLDLKMVWACEKLFGPVDFKEYRPKWPVDKISCMCSLLL